MSGRLLQEHARLQIRLGEMACQIVGGGSSAAADSAYFLIPRSDGSAPKEMVTVVNVPHEQTKRVARAFLASSEAIALITRWNSVVTPTEDPLRFVRKWAED